jgi:hypothetical protein
MQGYKKGYKKVMKKDLFSGATLLSLSLSLSVSPLHINVGLT